MSEDNRLRPHIIRVLPAVNKRVRAYAERQGVAPNVAAEDLMNGAAGEIAALDQALVALRADLESAREATRRADHAAAAAQEAYALASTERDDLRIQVAGLGKTVDAYSAKMASLKSELGDAANEIRRLNDVTAAAVRLVERRESELTEVRAALETKGATDRLAERVETIAAAPPDDFEAKIAERAPGWKGTADELRARVITLGFSRYDALATDAAKRAAERGR